MSRKTITMRVRNAKSQESRQALIARWLDDWQEEQKLLCDKMPLAIEINDFDEMCIINGQLREITRKKFEALYNVLETINLKSEAMPGADIYEWGKYQTGLIAIMGRKLADKDWQELSSISAKLDNINATKFNIVRVVSEKLL